MARGIHWLLLLLPLLGGGCGFHLRGELPASSAARTLVLTGIGPSNPFYGDFVQIVSTQGGRLVKKPDEAGGVVNILSARHARRPITLTSGGRANSFDLTFRLVYQVLDAKGRELIPEQELIIRRDYFNQQLSPLGQGEEEAMLRAEMEKEAAETLLRRVVYSLDHKAPKAS